MINIDDFIKEYAIEPGYFIKAKGFDGILDHWVVYLGKSYFQDENDTEYREQHTFALPANPKIRIVGEQTINNILRIYDPVEVWKCYRGIDKCIPIETARKAIETINEDDSFHLLYRNCQSFSAEISGLPPVSYQSQKFYFFLLLLLLVGLFFWSYK